MTALSKKLLEPSLPLLEGRQLELLGNSATVIEDIMNTRAIGYVEKDLLFLRKLIETYNSCPRLRALGISKKNVQIAFLNYQKMTNRSGDKPE